MGHPVELHVDADNGPNPISATQVKHLLQTKSSSAFFHLCVLPANHTDITHVPPSPPPTIIPAIEALLTKFHSLFQTPTSLPPTRSITHHFTLRPNIEPINVRPYRYPYFQKAKIEK